MPETENEIPPPPPDAPADPPPPPRTSRKRPILVGCGILLVLGLGVLALVIVGAARLMGRSRERFSARPRVERVAPAPSVGTTVFRSGTLALVERGETVSMTLRSGGMETTAAGGIRFWLSNEENSTGWFNNPTDSEVRIRFDFRSAPNRIGPVQETHVTVSRIMRMPGERGFPTQTWDDSGFLDVIEISPSTFEANFVLEGRGRGRSARPGVYADFAFGPSDEAVEEAVATPAVRADTRADSPPAPDTKLSAPTVVASPPPLPAEPTPPPAPPPAAPPTTRRIEDPRSDRYLDWGRASRAYPQQRIPQPGGPSGQPHPPARDNADFRTLGQ